MGTEKKSQATRCLVPLLGFTCLTLFTGCGHHLSHTDRGVIGGGVLGAGAGAIIGSATGNPEAGAAIGAGVGAVTGALTGSAIDQAEYRAERDVAIAQANAQVAQAQAARGPLGLEEIAEMSRQGVGDRVIIDQIRLTNVSYNLSADQIVWLKQNQVSDPVISAMQATGYGAPRPIARTPAPPRIIVEEEPVVIHRRPVYIHRPACCLPPVYRPRRPSFGISFTHHFGRGHCH